MKRDIFIVAFRNYLRRVSRDPLGLLIFVVLPIFLVFILSYIYNQNNPVEAYVSGYNMAASYVAMGMMVLFQLNGGVYLLYTFHHDLMKPMKWRLRSTPCPTYTLLFAGTAACIIFTFLQGVLIVIVTSVLFKAYWGNLWITLIVILLLSIISQFLNMILLFTMRNLTAAEYLSWFLSWIMAVLGGLMFPLPDNSFFRFMKLFGSPYSLSQTAIREAGILGTSVSNLIISMGALIGIVILLAGIVIILGRRKLQ